MFGKRSATAPAASVEPAPAVPAAVPAGAHLATSQAIRSLEIPEPQRPEVHRSDEYYQTKSMIFGALIEAIDLAQLSRLEPDAAREEDRKSVV
jgi:pilus assembly protein CpaF